MTVELGAHPYEQCTIAEAAAAGKRNGHNHAASLTYSVKAPIYLCSVGFSV